MVEVWKAVIGYEGQYEVSDAGNVRSVDRYVTMTSQAWNNQGVRFHKGTLLKQTVNPRGYSVVSLSSQDKKIKTARVHWLVIRAFKGDKPHPSYEICHNDGVKTHNSADNLRWDTQSNNQLDRVKHGTMPDFRGEKSVTAKLKEWQVLLIRKQIRKFDHECLATRFNVSISTIGDIVSRRTWKHI